MPKVKVARVHSNPPGYVNVGNNVTVKKLWKNTTGNKVTRKSLLKLNQHIMNANHCTVIYIRKP